MKEIVHFLTSPLQWTFNGATGALTPVWVNTDGCTFLVLVDTDGRSHVSAQLPPPSSTLLRAARSILVVTKMHSTPGTRLLLPPS